MSTQKWYLANGRTGPGAEITPFIQEIVSYLQPLVANQRIELVTGSPIISYGMTWEMGLEAAMKPCSLIILPLDQKYLSTQDEIGKPELELIRRFAGQIPIVILHVLPTDLEELNIHSSLFFPEKGYVAEMDTIKRGEAWLELKKLLVKRFLEPATAQENLGEFPYLDKLQVKGFKCFDEIELDFSRSSLLPGRWHCIAGINGAGKTSLLEAICLGFLGARMDQLGENLIARKQRTQKSEVLLTLNSPNPPLKIVFQAGLLLNQGTPEAKKVWDLVWNGFFFSLGSTRDFSENRLPLRSFSENLRRHRTLFDPLEPAIDHAGYYENVDPQQVRTILEKLLGQILEGFSITLGKGDSKLTLSIQGRPSPILELPSGIRSLVILLAAIAKEWSRCTPGITDLDQIRGLILLDEIDLHLHPQLQRLVVPRLRKALPQIQWIVTTHSPLILSCFDKNELTWLEPDGPKTADRQIFGYSPDDIYQYLMNTPPQSQLQELFSAYEDALEEDPDAARQKGLRPRSTMNCLCLACSQSGHLRSTKDNGPAGMPW